MSIDFYSKIKSMIENISLSKINLKLIKKNSDKLIVVYKELNIIWNKLPTENDIDYMIIEKDNSEYNKIIQLLTDSFLSENKYISDKINNTKYIHLLNYRNISFYWLSKTNKKNLSDKDYLLAFDMFKISLCLNYYKYHYVDNVKRYVIWIPICKERNFNYTKINKLKLKKSKDEYEAFVASGVTFGLEPRITIVTRYEEVEKLLIHELIHNYNIDGSGYHSKLQDVIEKYIQTKNKNYSKKNYSYEFSIYESYTELLSTYLYLLFANIKKNIVLTREKIMGKILLELIYSYNLICNLIYLNDYANYAEFKSKIFFESDICKYEYYYIKGLMYNNYLLEFGNKPEDFIEIYMCIIKMIEKIQVSDDKMLEEIYNNYVKQKNFKYQIH